MSATAVSSITIRRETHDPVGPVRDALAVASHAREPAGGRPSTVPIHDDGNVSGQWAGQDPLAELPLSERGKLRRRHA